MRKVIAGVAMFLFVSPLFAADTEEPARPQTQTPAPAAQPPAESEAQNRWKSLKTQEQWVSRLKKQLDGETRQLNELRALLVKNYELDAYKLENGDYEYDVESQSFVDKKRTQ